MNQHLLPGLDVRPLDQRLPRREGDQGQRRRLRHCQPGRLGCQVVLADRDEPGEGPDPVLVRACVDLIARREPVHTGPGPLHHAGEIVAEHERRLVGQHEPELAGHDLGVERVDPGGGDPDERVALASLRLGHLPCPQCAVLAVLADNKSLHVTASFTDSGP